MCLCINSSGVKCNTKCCDFSRLRENHCFEQSNKGYKLTCTCVSERYILYSSYFHRHSCELNVCDNCSGRVEYCLSNGCNINLDKLAAKLVSGDCCASVVLTYLVV